MIYTVTFNPSLDYVVDVKDFQPGIVNRTTAEAVYSGGKGINVSMVLTGLGIDNIALGFIAGFTGQEIQRGMLQKGCKTDFILLKEGLSRINIKLRSQEETEINANGPAITKADTDNLFAKLYQLQDGDILVLSGSIPSTLSSDIYEIIMERLSSKNIKIVVDATKDLLLNVLKYKPFLIKPNHHELGEMFHRKLTKKEDIIIYAKKLQEAGAQNVLVSMAGDGAILIGEDGSAFHLAAPKGKVKNSVGAGDSMVAGFLAGYLQNNSIKEAFRMGIAAGSASAFSNELATKDEILNLYQAL